MTKKLYHQPNIVETVYEPDTKSIIAAWQNLGPHDYLRPCTEAQLKCARQDDAKVVIVDTSKAKGVLKQEDQEWFGTYLFPKLQAAGIKAIITIVPSDALAKLTARQWTRTGQQFGVEFIDTATLQTARQLAKQYAQ